METFSAEVTDLEVIVKKTRDHLNRVFKRYLRLKNVKSEEFERVLRYFGYKIVGLGKLYPMLIDKKVDEIYIDPGRPIYLDHYRGRVETKITLSDNEIRRLVSLTRINGNAILTPGTPSSKIDLITNDFRVRISIDSPPLVPKGYAFDIRKLKKRPQRISLFTPSREKADLVALLIFSVALRANILIVGEPASGKTTLASLILGVLPSFWRIVSIEGVQEFPDFTKKKILRVKVSPFEDTGRKRTKEEEIIKLLHRSPDYVVLSEIQSKEHNEALFHAISAGIPVTATLHARNLSELINRWVSTFNIDIERVSNVDMLVIMRRKITPTSAIVREIQNIFLVVDNEIKDLFSRFESTRMKIYRSLRFFKLGRSKAYPQKKLSCNEMLKLICSKLPTVSMEELTEKKFAKIMGIFHDLRSVIRAKVNNIHSNRRDEQDTLTNITEKIYEYAA
ncbi:MAG: hypothetical protein GWN01_10700 [Nitrosopumilaceae archaeon]|nr:type II/IV secretion system ATPase subunit [Nitrosopumilaceae archaeon]NIU87707.1 hypothetical protein [Nitrosopumilaceae archaeon]NIV66103.1 hypothetical protein [Nitrosopumilaceae archaeon]NIX61963.1 hypothetical protein [Nitrosopumilaceae archaeon]